MYVYPTSILKSSESACMQSFIKIFYVFQSIMYFHPVNLAFIRSDTYFRILHTVYLVILGIYFRSVVNRSILMSKCLESAYTASKLKNFYIYRTCSACCLCCLACCRVHIAFHRRSIWSFKTFICYLMDNCAILI